MLSHVQQAPAVSLDDYQQLYEDTKQWIGEKTQLAKSRDFPSNATDMKACDDRQNCSGRLVGGSRGGVTL